MLNRSDLLYFQLQENLHKPLRDAVYYVELYPEYQIFSMTDKLLVRSPTANYITPTS